MDHSRNKDHNKIEWLGCDKCENWWHRECTTLKEIPSADLIDDENGYTLICDECQRETGSGSNSVSFSGLKKGKVDVPSLLRTTLKERGNSFSLDILPYIFCRVRRALCRVRRAIFRRSRHLPPHSCRRRADRAKARRRLIRRYDNQ